MRNVFIKGVPHNNFVWENLGDIEEGRGDLGETMPVLVYRLMQHTLLEAVTNGIGFSKANEHFRKAGFLAGFEFAKHLLNLKADFNSFASELQTQLVQMKIGIYRMDIFDTETRKIIISVGERLDGEPLSDPTVCKYEEGFLAGIMEAYAGNRYEVQDVGHLTDEEHASNIISIDRGNTMKNVFIKEVPHNKFVWENLGDIEGGRGDL
ncbi:MAG: hypothetical protein LBN43_05600, partial [Oscillospiraceae bacterium]|nr:hypothetical protein [Oscillospiraceae bacterium]